jgi:putative heme-binding domain-containing protein
MYETHATRSSATIAAAALLFVCAPLVAAQIVSQDHPGQYSQEDIARGSVVYGSQCNQCHGRDGDQVSGIDLRRGVFRRAQSDEDIARVIGTGTPGGMPPFRLQPSELAGIVAYIRAGFDTTANVRVGDGSRGREIFEDKGQCGSCHRVGGRGPRVAPDLSDVGLARAPAALERSIRDPSSAMLPINRPVRIMTKDGRSLRGRRLNEDTYTVQIIDEQERLMSIAKKDVRSLDVEIVSPMPAYAGRLTDAEIADLVAYLLTLRKP